MSTCHWCHVMENESFEDEEVADLLNQHFISIKVDKEERPDIDAIYMSVCQMLTGSGGWPLTIFLMPNQKPFYAGTYFPKHSSSYVVGLIQLLSAVKEKWQQEREELVESSELITLEIMKVRSNDVSIRSISREVINTAVFKLMQYFDKQYGGFYSAPKFPMPHNLMFLLRLGHLYQDKEALEAVYKTLDSMYLGGIYDHIGYGFSRYSTDQQWLVPHFEKMLYDNGLLIITYLEAYQISKNNTYKEIAANTLEYVLRELASSEGGFYCAQDADSEGVEGKYYVFTEEEILHILGEEDGRYFNKFYGITKRGNFEGKNIPNRLHIGILSEDEFTDRKIQELRKIVYDYRLTRTKLHKDDKILTSWNGIMLVVLAKAYHILGDENYLLAVKKAEEFIYNNLRHENRLYVRYRDHEASGDGHIDDYAYYIWGLIELYEVTYEPEYLKKALALNRVMIEDFLDEEKGGFYLYGKHSEQLIHRPKEIYDGAIPSGNAVALYNLIKLSRYTGDVSLTSITNKHLEFMASNISDHPSEHIFGIMVAMLNSGTKELICLLENQNQVDEMKKLLSDYFDPNLLTMIITPENREEVEEVAPFTIDYKHEGKLPAYYLCENHSCKAPVYNITELRKMLTNSKE